MKVSLRWLKDFFPSFDPLSQKDLGDRLTMVGLEVEGVEEFGRNLDGVVIGKEI